MSQELKLFFLVGAQSETVYNNDNTQVGKYCHIIYISEKLSVLFIYSERTVNSS